MSYLRFLVLIILFAYVGTVTCARPRPTERLKMVPYCKLKNRELEEIYVKVRERHDSKLWRVKFSNFTLDHFIHSEGCNISELDDSLKVTTDQPHIKEQICGHILESGWFYKILTVPLALNKWYRPWMLALEVPPSQKHIPHEKFFSDTPSFTYPSGTQKIHLMSGNTIDESLFLCLARTPRPFRRVIDLYISEEYNVNLTPDGDYFAGRFIFAKTESKQDKFVLTCLAEEPANVIADSPEEMRTLYSASRRDMKLGNRHLSKVGPWKSISTYTSWKCEKVRRVRSREIFEGVPSKPRNVRGGRGGGFSRVYM